MNGALAKPQSAHSAKKDSGEPDTPRLNSLTRTPNR